MQTASSGEGGFVWRARLLPVAITLDVMMPGMDGWTVLSKLKADPSLRNIPVIMLTMVDDPAAGLCLGASEYATKPVNRERLLNLLRKYRCDDESCAVLLVEHQAEERARTRLLLEAEGWQITEAEDGRAALDHMSLKSPTLISGRHGDAGNERLGFHSRSAKKRRMGDRFHPYDHAGRNLG